MSNSVSQLRSRLTEIDRDIVFHEIQLGLLRAERESTQRHLHTVAVYPVLTLPNEITSEIFIQWVHADQKSNPMLLTLVCKQWRAVAISTPQIWAPLKNMPLGKRFLAKWLSHTGSLPLNLSLSLRGPARMNYQDSFIYQTLSRHSSQMAKLTLGSNEAINLPLGPFPRLISLSICGVGHDLDRALVIDETAPLAAPQLRQLILKYKSELPGDALQVYLPCIQLTNLELKADAAECIKFLIHTPNLEHFTVDCEDGDLPDLNQWTSVTLPRLRRIRCAKSTYPALLNLFTLPALQELSIWLDPEWKEIVQRLIARSQCSIRKLDVHAYLADHELLTGFLELTGLQSVRDLTLRGPDGRDGALEELFLKIEDPSFLPLLQSFAIQGCEFLVPTNTVTGMLCARMKGEVKLKSFQFLLGGDNDEGRDDAEVNNCDAHVVSNVRKLKALCSQGLKVDFQSKFRFWNTHLDPSVIRGFRRVLK
ncbi:hypothetical protein FB45DRAFT_1053245 [Roridomyces roridus]|uniref:F-box domain-containing protein n=1 Tax=Roridomyces roridus TaxID=1738132 RepID=A0AAD7CC31_9AGAR|nr:hypothetical protein FB45DRAFT_1053245 [Roridomyces roridus]